VAAAAVEAATRNCTEQELETAAEPKPIDAELVLDAPEPVVELPMLILLAEFNAPAELELEAAAEAAAAAVAVAAATAAVALAVVAAATAAAVDSRGIDGSDTGCACDYCCCCCCCWHK